MPRSGRYRGRRRITRILSGIAITLVIASVLSVTAFLFLRNYITRTDEGLLLSFPFLDKAIAPPVDSTPEPDSGAILIVEPTPTPTPSPTPMPLPEPEPIPVSAQVEIKPAFLSQSDLNNKAKLDELAVRCEAGDVDTIIIEVKAISGVIATLSSVPADAAELFDGHIKLVAYFSALEDNTITRQRAAFGIKHSSGVNWLDANKSRWINPYVPEARDWLAAQLSAIDAGVFSAVLIDKLWLPTDGRLQLMVLNTEVSQDEILDTLKSELISATILPCWMVDLSTRDIMFDGNVLSAIPEGAFSP